MTGALLTALIPVAVMVGLLALALYALPGPQRQFLPPRTFVVLVAGATAVGLLVGVVIG